MAPLGILQNYGPATNHVACSPSPDFLFNKETGEIYDKATDTRLKRYIRQSAARRLLPNNRVSWCLRRVKENEAPAILKSSIHGKCHYGGLISCGKPWECTVCAAKISQRRRDELSICLEQWRNRGGSLLLVTFTFPHTRFDSLVDLLAKQDKARMRMCASREYKNLMKAHGVIGKVRALEITYGVNGFHPHIHEIWFIQSIDLSATKNAIFTRIYEIWAKNAEKCGLGRPTREHGVDVRDGSFASVYVSKWGIEDELTKSNAKEGKGNNSRSPFQLLDDYIKGDKQSGALYIEYVTAFAGKKQLIWSRGLKALFDLEEKTDDEIAAEQDDKAVMLGKLTLEQWAFIISYRGFQTDHRAALLSHAEFGGWDAVLQYLQLLELG